MKFVVFLLSLILIVSCSQKIVPEKPQSSAIEAPPEDLESSFEVPISLNLDDLNQYVESQIPQNLYSGTSRGTQTMTVDMFVGKVKKDYSWEVKYSVVKTGKISLSIDNEGALLFRIPLKIQANACAIVDIGTQIKQCGNSSPEIDLLVKSKIFLNPNWTFSSITSISYDLKKAVLNIPFQLGNFPLFSLNLDIKKDLQRPVDQNLNLISKQVDRQIVQYLNGLQIRDKVNTIWNTYSSSMKFSDNPLLFLSVQPKRISFSDLYSSKNSLGAKIGLYGVVIVSSKQITPTKNPLPALEKMTTSTGQTVINLPVKIDYVTLSKILKDNFADTTFVGSGYKFTAKDIRMYGDGKLMVIEIDYDAKLKGIRKKISGKMYFKALPAFDILTNTFYFENCKLSTETNSALTDKSFNKFANKTITNTVIKLTTYPMDKEINMLKSKIIENLKHFKMGLIDVNGRIDRIDFVDFYVEKDQINIYLKATGVLETGINLLNK